MKPRPRSSARARSPGGRGSLGRLLKKNGGASPRPEMDPAAPPGASSGASSGPPPEAGSAGAAAIAPQPSARRRRCRSSRAGQLGFWFSCLAAVSGARPRAGHRRGRPLACPSRRAPAARPRPGRPGRGLRDPSGGAGRVGREVWPRPTRAWTSRGREASGGWSRAGELPCRTGWPVPALRHPAGFAHLVRRTALGPPPAPAGAAGCRGPALSRTRCRRLCGRTGSARMVLGRSARLV